jgi:hypothetical protein
MSVPGRSASAGDDGGRAERVVLGGLGLLCVAAGVVALLVGAGVFGEGAARRTVLDPELRRFAASHGWFWPVVGIGCGLIAVGALSWMVRRLRRDRVRGFVVAVDELGVVRLPVGALTDAVAAEVAAVAGVAESRAWVRHPRDPALSLSVTVPQSGDVPEVAEAVCGRVLDRARGAVGRPGLRCELDIRGPVSRGRRARGSRVR